MRLIITEEQFNIVKDLYTLNEAIGEIDESVSLKQLVQKYKAALTAGIAASTILFSINALNLPGLEKDFLKKEVGVELSTNSQRQKRIDEQKQLEVLIRERDEKLKARANKVSS